MKEEIIPILHKLSQKIEKPGFSPNLIYKTRIILIPKSDTDITRKLYTDQYATWTQCKNSKNILNQIQQYIKEIIHHSQIGFIPGMQDQFNIWKSISITHHINKLEKKSYDHLNRWRKNIQQNPASFANKNSQWTKIRRELHQLDNGIHQKPIGNIILNSER